MEPSSRLTLEKEWWRGVVAETFGESAAGPRFEEFFQHLYSYFGGGGPWVAETDCHSLLSELNRRGFRLAVVSNFDSRLASVLAALDLARFFGALFISSQMGAAKPQRRFYRRALNQSGSQAGTTLHVGDDAEHDFNGARRAGLRAVLFDPAGKRPDVSERISRLGDLRAFLL